LPLTACDVRASVVEQTDAEREQLAQRAQAAAVAKAAATKLEAARLNEAAKGAARIADAAARAAGETRPPMVQLSAGAKASIEDGGTHWVLRVPKIQPRISKSGDNYVVGIAPRDLASEDGQVRATCCLYMSAKGV
jgi:hypothetical protein